MQYIMLVEEDSRVDWGIARPEVQSRFQAARAEKEAFDAWRECCKTSPIWKGATDAAPSIQ